MIVWIGWLDKNSKQATTGIHGQGKDYDRCGCKKKLCHGRNARNPDPDGNEKEAKKTRIFPP